MSGFTSMNRVDERPADSSTHSSSTQSSIDPHLTKPQKDMTITTPETSTTTLTQKSADGTSATQKPTDSTSTAQERSIDISSTTTASISTPQIDPMLDSSTKETCDNSVNSQSTSPSSSSVPQKRPHDEPAQTPTKVARVDQRNGHATPATTHTPTQTQNHNHTNNNHVAFAYNDQPSQSPQPPQPPQPQQPPQPPHNPFLYPQSRSRANPPLDMGSVDSRASTRLQYENGVSAVRNTRFKLERIPTVYPTMEDYQNRPKYMEMLHKYYGKYGMVKIVPPERCSIPFRLDTEVSSDYTSDYTSEASIVESVCYEREDCPSYRLS